MDENRKALIAKALAARQKAAAEKSPSESSSDSGPEIAPVRFVPRGQRTTLAQAEAQASAAAEAADTRRLEEEALRIRQKQITLAEAKLELTVNDENPNSAAPSLGIEDSAEAFARWKIREMKRIMKKPETESLTQEEGGKGVFFQ